MQRTTEDLQPKVIFRKLICSNLIVTQLINYLKYRRVVLNVHKLTSLTLLYWSQVAFSDGGSLRTTKNFGGQPEITTWLST